MKMLNINKKIRAEVQCFGRKLSNEAPCFSLYLIILSLWVCLSGANSLQAQTVVFYEGFESGSIPSTWSNQPVSGNVSWNVRTGAGIISPGTPGVIGDPDTAAFGNYNAVFQHQSYNQEKTKLISPPLNLEFVVFPELTFWHAQNAWGPVEDQGQLRVYYKTDTDEPWILLAEYLTETQVWTERVIPLPNGSANYYIAFEGFNGFGMGVCIDEVVITETGIVPRFVTAFRTRQASSDYVPTGSINNLIIQSEIRVFGNQGSCLMETFKVKSLNTDDNDIAPNGVKLWATQGESFVNPVQLGSSTNFVNGVAVFSGLNKPLPTGYSYYWVSFDISSSATPGNFVDAELLAQTLLINDTLYPSSNQNPPGARIIYETLLTEDFDSENDWILTGEWEIAIPMGLGGSGGGGKDPTSAYIGTKVLGTDLTGLGVYPGDYEPGLLEDEYQAISPEMDCFYYTNVTLRFHRWLNIEITDRAKIQVTYDDGATWHDVWKNQAYFSSSSWGQQTIALTPINRKPNARFRFTIGPTDFNYNFSGWNIDNIVVTGDFVTKDVGVIGWLSPNSQCGLTNQEEITVMVKNLGAAASPAVIPIGFSLDGGITWQMDTLYESIPVEGTVMFTFSPKANFSTPGRYNVVAKTFLSTDQDPTNDAFEYKVFSVPTIEPPYSQNFELNDGFWDGGGTNSSWEWGVPSSWFINTAGSGNYAWVTNLSGYYNSNEVSFLVSPCFDFSNHDRPVLEFRYRTHLPDNDGFTIQYSLNGGVSWQILPVEDPQFAWNWNPNSNISSLQTYFGSGTGWSGDNGQWKRARMILPAFLGNQPNVKFRFGFAGITGSGSFEGIGIDAINVYQAPHDIGVEALVQPISFCELSDEETIAVSVKNFGFSTLEPGTVVPVGVDLDANAPVVEEFILDEELLPGASVTFVFQNPFTMSGVGSYTIRAYTLLPGDTDFYTPGVFNDTLITQVSVFGYPEISLGPDIYTLQSDTVLLDPGPGFVTYLWNTGHELQTFQVSSPHTAVYSVTVTDNNNCPAWDSVNVITYDLSVFSIHEPESACELSSSEQITVAVKNQGVDAFDAGTSFDLILEPLGGETFYATVVLTQDLLPGEVVTYTFGQTFDLSEFGAYTYNIATSFQDANPLNNVLQTTIFAHGYPEVSLGDDIYTLNPESVILTPGSQYSTYLWQDNSTDESFQVTSPYSAQYSVSVTDEHGCPGEASVWVYTYDFEVSGLSNPLDACSLSGTEAISVNIRNNGPDTFEPGLELTLTAIFQGNILAQELMTVNEVWAPLAVKSHTFAPTVDLSETGSYSFRLYFSWQDANAVNDTLDLIVVNHGYPEPTLPDLVVTNQPDTVVLDPGAGFTTYMWNNGHEGQTLAISEYGWYYVTVTNSFGCATIDSVLVEAERFDMEMFDVVSPYTNCLPGESWPVTLQMRNSGNMEIQSGSQLFVSYQLGGGVPVASPVSITQVIAPGGFISFTFPQNIVLPEGAHSVFCGLTFEFDEVSENNTLFRMVHVYPPAEVDLGPDIYENNPVGMVLDAGPGFDSYLWQDGSSTQTYQITFPSTAPYSVTVTNSNGCQAVDTVWVITFTIDVAELLQPQSNCTLSNAENVVVELVNPGPDIFEVGHEFTLSYKMNMFPVRNKQVVLTQAWPVGESLEVSFANPENLSQIGLYLFKIYTSLPNSDTLSALVQNDGLPQVYLGEDIYTTLADTVVLNAGPGFIDYLWQDGSTAQTFHVSNFGFHWVQVSDIYGCTNRDTIYIGLYDNIETYITSWNLKIYPNPASDRLFVEVKGLTSEAQLRLINLSGQVMLSRKVNKEEWLHSLELDVSELPKGIYLLNVTTSSGQKSVRVKLQ